MNSISMLSTYSTASSIYSTAQTSLVKPQEESSVAKNKLTSATPTGEINDVALISDEAKAMLAKEQSTTQSTSTSTSSETGGQKLTPEEQTQVAKLQSRDAEVRTHEQAHIAAAAGINASAPSYTYETGPDGNKYAVAGEVSISISESNDPNETIAKASTLRAAALAPAQPSSQDLSVARHAAVIMAEAEQALSQDQGGSTDTPDSKKKEAPTIGAGKPDKAEQDAKTPVTTTGKPDEAEAEEEPTEKADESNNVEKAAA